MRWSEFAVRHGIYAPDSPETDSRGPAPVYRRMPRKARLVAFNAVSYLATVQLVDAVSGYLPSLPVSRDIPAAEMVAGRYVLVNQFNPLNPDDAAVVAVWV